MSLDAYGSQTLAQLVAREVHSDPVRLPTETREYAKDLVLSCLGAAIAGSQLPAGRILLAHARASGGTPEATVFLSGQRFPLETAALTNNTLWHATELEGNSYPEVVSMFTLVPPLLAVSEATNASGEAFLTAAILGHEVQARLSLASNTNPNSPTSFHYMNMHVMGGIAVAAASARLMRLDAATTATAISLAASQAAGVVKQTGWMAHYVESGFAGRNGITATLLARAGLTANPEILETEGGLVDIAGGYIAGAASALEGWGNPFRVTEQGEKTYPCCYLMQHLMQTLREAAAAERFSAADVVSITVRVNKAHGGICRFQSPDTSEQAQFSIPHGLAVALLDSDIGVLSFVDARVRAEQVRLLRERVAVEIEDLWEDGTLRQPHLLIVQLRDGRRMTLTATNPHGHPPDLLTRQEIVGKFRACSVSVIGNGRADRVQDAVLGLDRLSSVGELTALLEEPATELRETAMSAEEGD